MASILKYAGKYRRHIFTALALISISVPIGVVPYFLISDLIGKYISEAAAMADVVRTSAYIDLLYGKVYPLRRGTQSFPRGSVRNALQYARKAC